MASTRQEILLRQRYKTDSAFKSFVTRLSECINAEVAEGKEITITEITGAFRLIVSVISKGWKV